MVGPLIIYYGNSGLESQVFQSYMASSGYKVQVVSTREGAISALHTDPAAIAVIALEKKQQELIEQAQALRTYADQSRAHFFVLSTEDGFEMRQSWIDIIPRPYRLSELVRRIQSLMKDSKKGGLDSPRRSAGPKSSG